MRKCVLCHMRTTKAQISLRVRCLDSIISLDSIAQILLLLLASVAAQAGLCLAWSETPEDTFCRVVAHLEITTAVVVPCDAVKFTSKLSLKLQGVQRISFLQFSGHHLYIRHYFQMLLAVNKGEIHSPHHALGHT